jgi:pyruvate dehydrogenase E2 component (dihydrolipoamide acetyltransferase)
MVAAKQTVPHLYLAGDVCMGAATAMIERMRAEGSRITVTALLVRAAARALREHPRLNASFRQGAIVLNRECNVGVAVAVDDGLFVPVIRQADAKALPAIASELKSLAETARAGRLTPGQYEGGSITISNLGMYGVRYFLPIINPPECCILGVGAIREEAVVREGGIRVDQVMTISISADHRATDGAEVARFYQTLKGLLEEPEGLAT